MRRPATEALIVDQRPALLIIDMFTRFDFPGGRALAPLALHAAGHIARLRRHFDARHWPVIYANDNFSDWQCDFRQQVERCQQTPGQSSAIAALLAPLPGHYFVLKPKHSAFLATPLPILLAKLDTRRLVVCGMTADACVMATTLDAKAREHDVVLAREAIAGLPVAKQQALDVMRRSDAAEVCRVASILRWR